MKDTKGNIVEVEQSCFWINPKDPYHVTYNGSGMVPFMLSTYIDGLPIPEDGDVLYKLKGYEDKGFLLKKEYFNRSIDNVKQQTSTRSNQF